MCAASPSFACAVVYSCPPRCNDPPHPHPHTNWVNVNLCGQVICNVEGATLDGTGACDTTVLFNVVTLARVLPEANIFPTMCNANESFLQYLAAVESGAEYWYSGRPHNAVVAVAEEIQSLWHRIIGKLMSSESLLHCACCSLTVPTVPLKTCASCVGLQFRVSELWTLLRPSV